MVEFPQCMGLGDVTTWASEAERRTARRLAALEPEGWMVVHGARGRHHSAGHVVAGPPGIVVIDSVIRFGDIDLAHDTLGHSVGAAAAALRKELGELAPGTVPVQAAVAVWARFPAHVVDAGHAVLVHGERLVAWLCEQPRRLRDDRVDELVAVVQQLAR